MIDKKQFYAGMRKLPAAVSIISAIDEDNSHYAMTASSVTSLSDDPPSLLACVNKSAGLARVLKEGVMLSISVLGQSQVNISNACASTDKSSALFEEDYWEQRNGLFYVRGAQVVFHCLIDKIIAYATHEIVLANITSLTQNDEAHTPLVYYNAGYREIAAS